MKNFNYLLGCMLFLFFVGTQPAIATITNTPFITSEDEKGTVTGRVMDGEESIPFANVVVKGTTTGTTTDYDGYYSMDLEAGTYILEVSYVGYETKTQEVTVSEGGTATADFNLSEGIALDQVVVIGTRAPNRTNTDAPVPIDVINVGKLATAAPQTSLNQIMHQTAPSFSSNTQTISDGTDHIDPASLRGLGPDQVLVLLNGKRRHTTSLVNINGTFGRGNVGTDLNAIPASAIETIEVLRDGAAAQYGSDAIAGVINLRMKESVNQMSLNLTTGANFTSKIGPFEGETKSMDGEVLNLGVNYGLPLGDKGGVISLSGEMNFRAPTNRMQEFNGQIFKGYNAVEREALQAGEDISALSMADVQAYAQNVAYFSDTLKAHIMGAPTMDSLQTLLNFDNTDDELSARGRARSDYNMRVGQSRLRGGKLFANLSLPLGDDMELYSFGGIGYRDGQSGCFYRLPFQNRTTTAIYPEGTVPKINSNIKDQSIGAGIRGSIGEWGADFSNVYGSNTFIFDITDSHNATLGSASPTTFNSGGHAFIQNTSNVDLSRYFNNVGPLLGINFAFGAEYRYENFKVIPGTEVSHGNYDINGNLINPTTPDGIKPTDFYGSPRPSGAQCFAGFLPSNEVDANRSSVGAYLDGEFDVTESLLLTTALRFENYSDFGSTLNYKVSGRYKVLDALSIRGAASSGFRAPSLHQIHFSRTSTIFELVNGVSVAQEVGVFANTSRVAKLLGIPDLKEERSQNYSAGITARIPSANVKITVDGYMVNIQDRIVLTGTFSAGGDTELISIFQQAGATRAAFFANAIDTRSSGLDIVVSHSLAFGPGESPFVLRNDLAATFSKTVQDGDIKASPILEAAQQVDTYFDQTSRLYLEQAVPRIKWSLGNTLTKGGLSVYLRNTFFGRTTEATNESIFDADLELLSNATIDPYNKAKVVTDLSLGYEFLKGLSITIGANNLFDVYPDEADPAFQSSGRFVYSRRAPQFSFGGRHLFARLAFTLK